MGKLGQEPAFPLQAGIYLNRNENGIIQSDENGMSKRLWVATQITAGIITKGYMSQESMVENAYKITDELLKQENK